MCLADADVCVTKARRYTLTHNDVTGALLLTIGTEYNAAQTSGWCVVLSCCCPLPDVCARYTRLLRDEVLAEWCDGSLHVHCHVRGVDDFWLAPAPLRHWIFSREMSLVLDTLRFGDGDFLRAHAHLSAAQVLVHFHSVESGHAVRNSEPWGALDAPVRGGFASSAAAAVAALASPQERSTRVVARPQPVFARDPSRRLSAPAGVRTLR